MNREQLECLKIGIDFGTCFSYPAYLHAGVVKVLKNTTVRHLDGVPSVFYYGTNYEEREYLCGHLAAEYAIGSGFSESSVVRYIKQQLRGKNNFWLNKRVLGDFTADIRWDDFLLQGKEFTPSYIVACLIENCIELAKSQIGKNAVTVSEAVIAIPAYFSRMERDVLLDAANHAGINKVRFIYEPIAAAIDYCETMNDVSDPVLVYDLGGGTIDVACLRKQDKKTYEVFAIDGARIGGIDWDKSLAKLIVARLGDKKLKCPPAEAINILTLDPYGYKESVSTARLKHKLSDTERSSVRVRFDDVSEILNKESITRFEGFDIGRKEFEDATQYLLDGTLDVVRSVIAQCGINERKNMHLVLTGGGSYMPQIEPAVCKVLYDYGINIINKKPAYSPHLPGAFDAIRDISNRVIPFCPETAIASGAARYASGNYELFASASFQKELKFAPNTSIYDMLLFRNHSPQNVQS